MKIARIVLVVLCVVLVGAACGGGRRARGRAAEPPVASGSNERACTSAGWQAVTANAGGRERRLLWKGPAGPWKGAIVVLHGGGGSDAHWCHAASRIVEPQVEFSNTAIRRGFGVFALDSTNDVVTDANGRPCGKRFDATVVEGRPNVDLPFIEAVLTRVIPEKRPPGSSSALFMTGESTGGYMTVRASTRFDNLVTAFAPGAAGDPYGTFFDCDPRLSARQTAKGRGYDLETRKEIIEPNACVASSYPNERPWETANPARKPVFKGFHHENDGISDLSCHQKMVRQLVAHGYRDDGSFIIKSRQQRSVLTHLWQSAYNDPLLSFFERVSAGAR